MKSGKILFVCVQIIFLTSFVMSCHAGDASKLNSLQGLYKYKFPNELMNGKKYVSENSLVLLKVSNDAAYFYTHLDWANGHTCDFSGVATYQENEKNTTLVYQTDSILGKTCNFNIVINKNSLEFKDIGYACRLFSCGSRGMLDGVEFKMSTRTKLVKNKVINSDDYKTAIKEYEDKESKVKINDQ